MDDDHARILTDALRVTSSDVRWYFTADFYDGPISGLALFREQLYRFCCFPEDIPHQHVYVLHELTPEELTEELGIKAKFEAFVGTHWSFDKDGKRVPRILRPSELWHNFYDEKKLDRVFDPRDRPVVAWFDVVPNGKILA